MRIELTRLKIVLWTLVVAAPAAFATPAYMIYGSANGGAAAYASSSGARACNYGMAYGTTSCQIDNSGVIPLTYYDFETGMATPFPDFSGTNTSFIANLSSNVDAAGLHSAVSLDVAGNFYIPGFNGSYFDNVAEGGGSGTANAEEYDSLTPIAPAGWAGGPFYMQFTFQADGETNIEVSPGAAITAANYAYGQLTFQTSLGYAKIFQFPSYNVQSVGDYTFNTSLATAPIEFTSLNAFEYYFTLETTADISCSTFPNLGVCSASASAQMSNTATLTGIEFETATGTPIPGFSIESPSGTNYDALITSNAPEPGTVWMLAGGLALAGIGRLRIKKNASKTPPRGNSHSATRG